MARDAATPIPPETLEAVTGGLGRPGSTEQHIGTAGDDLLQVKGADGYAEGGEGNDTLLGGSGSDLLRGGAGDDGIVGGAGSDNLDGGDGTDRAYGGLGSDVVRGGAGGDLLSGAFRFDGDDGAADQVLGEAGNDTLLWAPGGGNDTLIGGTGHDVVEVTLPRPTSFIGSPADDLSIRELLQHLAVEGGLTMVIWGHPQTSEGLSVTFVNPADRTPASASGSFTLNGETVRFEGVETLRITYARS